MQMSSFTTIVQSGCAIYIPITYVHQLCLAISMNRFYKKMCVMDGKVYLERNICLSQPMMMHISPSKKSKAPFICTLGFTSKHSCEIDGGVFPKLRKYDRSFF